MDARELPARPSLEPYALAANDLFNAHGSGDPEALGRIRTTFTSIACPTWSSCVRT